jgi:hypothetical protein
MIWLTVAVIVVCAAFSGTYLTTGDIWTAVFAGGIPALFYMVGLAFQAVRQSKGKGGRIVVLVVAFIVLTGVSAQFVIISSTTRWQTDQVAGSGESIDRGTMMIELFERATPVFYEFQKQGQRKKHSVAELFRSAWGGRDWQGQAVFLESPSERRKVYASLADDGSVVLTGVCLLTKGSDASFANVNGTSGYAQSRVHLTARGMDYEIEN